MATVYIDRVTSNNINAFLGEGISKLVVLEKINKHEHRYINTLKKNGINVEEANFFLGDLRSRDEEPISLFFAARKLAGEIALEAAHLIIENQPLLKKLNTVYGRETVRLSLAKNIRINIEVKLMRVLAAQTLSDAERPHIWLETPSLFDGRLLEKYLPNVRLHFYREKNSLFSIIAVGFLAHFARGIKRIMGFGSPIKKRSKDSEPSVLMSQEDTVRVDPLLRGQPHWVDSRNAEILGPIFISNLSSILSVSEDAGELAKAGVLVVKGSTVRAAWGERKSAPCLQQVSKNRRSVFWAIFFSKDSAEIGALLHVFRMLWEAEVMGALAIWLNTRVFLFRETHALATDALQLVAPQLNIKMIAYQYSNVAFLSPSMLTTADYFVVFSDVFKKIFQVAGISPQKWVIGGYLYDGVANLVRHKAQKHRETMLLKGAQFIVCYFDESVQHDRWGLISKEDHLAELHILAKAVLEDVTFGVVVKSQFMRNSPSRLYPDDELIQLAKTTGRYTELASGAHRNDIHPVEAALTADMCIGHKFGATAALEAAIAGQRTVLINSHGTKTVSDAVYTNCDIEYKAMVHLMDVIAKYRAGDEAYKALGDWTPIIHYFDPYRDGNAVSRLRSLINQCLNEVVGQIE